MIKERLRANPQLLAETQNKLFYQLLSVKELAEENMESHRSRDTRARIHLP